MSEEILHGFGITELTSLIGNLYLQVARLQLNNESIVKIANQLTAENQSLRQELESKNG